MVIPEFKEQVAGAKVSAYGSLLGRCFSLHYWTPSWSSLSSSSRQRGLRWVVASSKVGSGVQGGWLLLAKLRVGHKVGGGLVSDAVLQNGGQLGGCTVSVDVEVVLWTWDKVGGCLKWAPKWAECSEEWCGVGASGNAERNIFYGRACPWVCSIRACITPQGQLPVSGLTMMHDKAT